MNTLQLSTRPSASSNRGTRREPKRTLTDVDRRRLGTLIFAPLERAWGTSALLDELETVLEDAEYVAADEVPGTLVTMNTTVELEEIESGARRVVTVVYPQEAEDARGAASIVEPLGLAALGCRVGDVIQCPSITGPDLRIAEIVYQPEQAEAEHL